MNAKPAVLPTVHFQATIAVRNTTTANLGGSNVSVAWQAVYLVDTHQRLQSQIQGFHFSISDIHDLQSLCPCETIALGFSQFYTFFTYGECESYEYSTDLDVFYGNIFGSPIGRAAGAGWVEEFRTRLKDRLIIESVLTLVPCRNIRRELSFFATDIFPR